VTPPPPSSSGATSVPPLTASGAAHAPFFADLRAREYARLDESGQVYLDYTGSGLYGSSQLRWHRDWLAGRVLGNPHSENPASLASTRELERVRERLFVFFRADPAEYELVFTANATAAIKLVAEAFPFGPRSRYVMALDNHNSVGGIREYARRRGASVTVLPLDDELRLDDPVGRLPAPGAEPSLFAYPAQSNFSGVRQPLSLVRAARERGYRVLLDTAAFAPTNRLDLADVGPDFACVSFYKMFGYPTGLGALLARREALEELRRPWFAGGAVDFVSIQNELHQLRPAGGAFEDGTPDFLGIAALAPGLALLESVGMERLSSWLHHLTSRLLTGLSGMRHGGGSPAVELYGPDGTQGRGATVAFNLLDREGGAVPYELVEAEAREAGISIRGGCFCNPGAGEAAFGIPAEDARRCLEETRQDFTLARFRECLGQGIPVGAVRASLGLASIERDVDRTLELLARAAAAHG
jgi:selenocysteine lyase/cysteine desulfurase